MRVAFAEEIEKLALNDPSVVLLSGDIGNRMFDGFQDKMPDRFYNCGIAEASMMSLSAGLALNGFRPFVYTITPFNTLRCLEQIKLDVCYHEAPVTIVGTGSGLSYAQLGPTHHSLDDISLMRAMPNMVVFCPCDSVEVRHGMQQALKQRNPLYIRLGKKGEPVFHGQKIKNFDFGKLSTIEEGTQICILSTGNTMPIAISARQIIEKAGLSCRVDSFHTVKPLDDDALAKIFVKFKAVCVLEEHSIIGGANSAVSEWLIKNLPKFSYKLISACFKDKFYHTVGTQSELRQAAGITGQEVAKKITDHVSGNIQK